MRVITFFAKPVLSVLIGAWGIKCIAMVCLVHENIMVVFVAIQRTTDMPSSISTTGESCNSALHRASQRKLNKKKKNCQFRKLYKI